MESLQTKEQLKIKFEEEFIALVGSKKENHFYLNESQYNKILAEVHEAKNVQSMGGKLTEVQIRRLQRYDIAFDKLVANNGGNFCTFRKTKFKKFCCFSLISTYISKCHGSLPCQNK